MRRPTPGETRVFESVLVALADHGFTPTAIAARLTYLSAPDSLQGALAAGLLGGGSRFLGVTEDAGTFLHARPEEHGPDCPADDAGVGRARAGGGPRRPGRPGRFVPGLGHPVAQGRSDPRTPVCLRSPRRRACAARTCGCTRRSAGCTPQVLGRTLPLNGAGVCGAALADLGLPVELLRGVALLARAAGLLGQLAEERRRPIGMDIYLAVDRNAVSRPSGRRRRVRRLRSRGQEAMAARRRDRLDPPPVLLPGQHGTGAERPPFADEWVRKIESFRETLTKAPA